MKKRWPVLKSYRLLSLDPMPVKKLLSWVRLGGSGSVYDRRCRRIRVHRDKKSDDLFGSRITSRTYGRKGRVRTKTEKSDEYTFDSTITLTDGGTEYFERRRRRGRWRWLKVGGAAHGCARSVGHFLARVTKTAAYWDGIMVSLSPVCSTKLVRVQHCLQGGTRRCRSCQSWGVRVRSLTAKVGFGRGRAPIVTIGPAYGPGRTPLHPVDCNRPCPGAAAQTKAVAKLRKFLKGRRFLTDGGSDHPYLFRTRRACRRYRAKKRIPKDDLDVW